MEPTPITNMPHNRLKRLANENWTGGLNRKHLPGLWSTHRAAHEFRKALDAAADVLNQDRAHLTGAMVEMQKPENRASLDNMRATFSSVFEYLDCQKHVLQEALRRLEIAEARVELVRRECGNTQTQETT